MDGKVQGLN